MTAFSIALVVSYFYPSLEGVLFPGVKHAVSRIVLGMHFLSDVLAGVCDGRRPGLCFDHGVASLGSSSGVAFACLPLLLTDLFLEEFETVRKRFITSR